MTDPCEETDEIIAEDWPTYWTQVPVWVLLANTSGQAYKLYAFLAEHINTRQPGQRIACPKQTAIARVLGLSNARQVSRYSSELEGIGAVRVSQYRYANGMRRGYRYHLRFNPPEGWAGLVSLSQFYDAHPDLKSASKQGRVAVGLDDATDETAGQAGGTKNSTTGGTKNSTAHGAKNRSAERDQQELDQEERDDAPSARSANDAGGNSSGSRDRGTGGAAASGKTRHRLSKAQYAAISAVRELLPDDLNKALPAKTPTNVSAAVLEALAVGSPFERTPAQLVEFRVMPRWRQYWVDKFYAGELGSIVGPFLAMLKQQTCGDLSCEEKVNINTGWPCRICEGRRAGKPSDRDDAREHPPVPDRPTPALPTPRSPTLAERPKCPGCERPLTDTMQPEMCRDCREGASV